MIIVNLMGGLGNQMFQYAAARHIAILRQTSLKIDTSRFKKLTLNKEHTVQLTDFRIVAEQATDHEISAYVKRESRYSRFLRQLIPLLRRSAEERASAFLYEEPAGSAFKPDILNIGPDGYLIGHFNSYKYFSPIRDVLVREFSPRESVSEEARRVLHQIGTTTSVGIHIRRGDYVTDPNVRKSVDGIITDHYYANAIRHVMSRVTGAHFFIFSNDMPWVLENVKIPARVTYVNSNPPQRGFEDLWLMSRCRHNIVAGGSTFSWWAAYLNENPDKLIIRTEKISNDPMYNHPEDYFPPEWEVVASCG